MHVEYYCQDTRGTVGNAMSWWKKDAHGYSCNIEEAERKPLKHWKDLALSPVFKLWDAEHIDANIRTHVDPQSLDHRTHSLRPEDIA